MMILILLDNDNDEAQRGYGRTTAVECCSELERELMMEKTEMMISSLLNKQPSPLVAGLRFA